MTVENCERLLKVYKEQSENESLSSAARAQSLKNYEMMKAHILKGRKFKGTAVYESLTSKPKAEVKESGKKSKR